MEIKQQKMIKAFLTEEFGSDKGNSIFTKQSELLDEIIKKYKRKNR